MAVTKAEDHPEEIFNVHLTTPPIRIFTFLVVIMLVLLHRKKGIQSSGLLFLFCFGLAVMATVQYRTEIRYIQGVNSLFAEGQSNWRDYKALSYMIYFPLITVLWLLNCVSDRPPSDVTQTKMTSPEVGASYLRRLFFQWFDPIAWHGYRRPLQVEEIYDLPEEDSHETIIPPFEMLWQQSVDKSQKKKTKKKDDKTAPKPGETSGSILPAMFKAFGGPFLFAGLLKLSMDLLSFVSPVILG